jgi:eukaryotic-like serine/threonine-protein kinase
VSLKELPLPSIASLRAIAALKSPHLALVRPARIGLGFESAGANQKTLAEVERMLGGPGRLSLSYSLRWLVDVLTGIGVLHRTLSFVHGEIQPENVVLGDDGVGRLIPVVRAHWVRGEERPRERLYYLAPEKLLGDRVDVRADVFSVGVMLWEALSGQRLLEAYTVDDIIARLMGGGIPRAHAPEGEAWTAPLSSIAERAIAIDPARRFATVAEMKAAIEGACQRYLASAPGMAELFGNPEARARSQVRDSLPPESQRVTLPPDHAALANAEATAPKQAELEAAAERLSRTSFFPIDIHDELTTKRNVVSAPQPEPLPVVRQGRHVKTLLGVPPPAIEAREPSAPDSVTLPFAKVAASTAPPVVIPTISPSASEPPPAPLPFGKTRQQFGLPEPTRPDDHARAAAVQASAAAALAPAVAAVAERANSPAPLVAEPSFELMRPRKRRGALWLVLGAAAAIGVFAARPWLARQLAAAAGTDTTVPAHVDAQQQPALAPAPRHEPNIGATASNTSPIGIASTPPAPSLRLGAPRTFGGPREEHVVIPDRLEPDVMTPPQAEPAAPPEPAREEPAAEPPPAPPAPVVPPPAAKPKSAPVSDADRYGI